MTRVLVSAGTYHLPFHRLTEWVSEWFRDHPDVDLVVQHGPSRPVPGATNHQMLPYQDLLTLCADADAVVLQGGAGGVMDMQRLGIVPIVVPRVPQDDEVVDDHQLVFTEEMARLGVIHRATSQRDLAALLDRAIKGELSVRAMTALETPGILAFRDLPMPPPRIPIATTLTRLIRTAAALLTARWRKGR